MTCSRARLGFLAAALMLAPLALAAGDPPSPTPTPVPTVQLKDGRVLHNVRVMTDEGANVVVRSDEGLLQLAKADLPPGLIEVAPAPPPQPAGPTQYVMQRFDPNQAPEAPPPEPGAKPKANAAVKPGSPAPASNPVAGTVYRGCTIMSFQIKAFQNVQGCAEVIIRNDTDQAVAIRPGEVSCATADGARHVARNIITGGFPPAVKKREFVPANGQLDDIFAFANEPLQISSVQWTR
jgi:hypothetical protein